MITVPGDFDIMCVECVLGTHSLADWFPRRVASMYVFAACCTYVYPEIIMRTMRYLYAFTGGGGHTAERKLRAGIDRQEMTQTREIDFHSTHCRIWITRPRVNRQL